MLLILMTPEFWSWPLALTQNPFSMGHSFFSGTIHWVARDHALRAEVRLYDRLFEASDPDDVPEGKDFTVHLNPESLVVLEDARVEPSVLEAPAGPRC